MGCASSRHPLISAENGEAPPPGQAHGTNKADEETHLPADGSIWNKAQAKELLLDGRDGDVEQRSPEQIQDRQYIAADRIVGHPAAADGNRTQPFFDQARGRSILACADHPQPVGSDDQTCDFVPSARYGPVREQALDTEVQPARGFSSPDLRHSIVSSTAATKVPNVSRSTTCASSAIQLEDSGNAIDVMRNDETPETEETAWARLEEKLLAESCLDSASQDQSLPLFNLADVEETLVFEDEGGELKCLDQETTTAMLELKSRRISKVHARNGHWATGKLAQAGALMAGSSNALPSTYSDCNSATDSDPDHVFVMGDECDMDIDSVDDFDTYADKELCRDINTPAQSLSAGNM
eukprot:jgi/Ulvmu1/4810/UM020_0095.1